MYSFFYLNKTEGTTLNGAGGSKAIRFVFKIVAANCHGDRGLMPCHQTYSIHIRAPGGVATLIIKS